MHDLQMQDAEPADVDISDSEFMEALGGWMNEHLAKSYRDQWEREQQRKERNGRIKLAAYSKPFVVLCTNVWSAFPDS